MHQHFPATAVERLLVVFVYFVLLPCVSAAPAASVRALETGDLPVWNWHHLVIWLVSHNVIDEVQTCWWTLKEKKNKQSGCLMIYRCDQNTHNHVLLWFYDNLLVYNSTEKGKYVLKCYQGLTVVKSRFILLLPCVCTKNTRGKKRHTGCSRWGGVVGETHRLANRGSLNRGSL